MSETKSESKNGFFMAPPSYSIGLFQCKIENRKLTVIKNHWIELTDETANVDNISRIISKKLNITNPILLNCNLERIVNGPKTNGEGFWNRRFKFYFTSGAEWDRLGDDKHLKGVAHPITPAETIKLKRSKSFYLPVTLPKPFRRCLTRIKLLHDNLLVFKNLPFDLTEYTANVYDVGNLIKSQYGMQDPIILDQRYQEVKDDKWTRGEFYWNTNRNLYFIERSDWCYYQKKRSRSRDAARRIEHVTYFDRTRSTFFKRN